MNKFFKIEQNCIGCFLDALDKIKFTIIKIYQRLVNDNKNKGI